jgi:hypothetical protein
MTEQLPVDEHAEEQSGFKSIWDDEVWCVNAKDKAEKLAAPVAELVVPQVVGPEAKSADRKTDWA